MATKIHCDRCDIWLGEGEGHYPQTRAEISHTFLADKGQVVDNPAPLKIAVTVTQYNGDGEDKVTLCDDCQEAALDAFAKARVLRHMQSKGPQTHSAIVDSLITKAMDGKQ